MKPYVCYEAKPTLVVGGLWPAVLIFLFTYEVRITHSTAANPGSPTEGSRGRRVVQSFKSNTTKKKWQRAQVCALDFNFS